MRVLAMHKEDKHTTPPTPELFEKMGQLIAEMTKAGILVATGGIPAGTKRVRLKFTDGKPTVLDGPFPETKELIAGFALLEVKSMEEALEWTNKFGKLLGSIECELAPLPDFHL